MAQVCKRWHEVCSQEELWKTLTIRRFGYSNTNTWNSYFQFLHNPPKKVSSFEDFRFTPQLLKGIEDSVLTYQPLIIFPILLGQNVLFIQHSGTTGKSMSVVVSILQKLNYNKRCSVVMLFPIQEPLYRYKIYIKNIGGDSNVVVKAIGVDSDTVDANECHIVLSTPQWLLREVKNKQFSFENVDIVLIDELDSFGRQDKERELRQLVNLAPKKTQWIVTTGSYPTICEDLFGPLKCHTINLIHKYT